MLNRIKKYSVAVALVAFVLCSQTAMGGEDAATVTINATVEAFAEWEDDAPTIATTDWDNGDTITASGQAITASLDMTLFSNITATVTPTAGANSGILTNGTETLETSYMVTGDVTTDDVDYVAAGSEMGEFFNAGNTYEVAHVSGDGGNYSVVLGVKAVSPSDGAVDAGDYTCGVVMTASW